MGFCVLYFRGEHSGTLMVLFTQEAYGTVKPLGCLVDSEQIWK